MFNFSLPQDEELIAVIKCHWSSYLIVTLKVFFIEIALGLLLALIYPFWWEEKWGRISVLVLVLLAFVYLLVSFWKRFLTSYIITKQRLIDITQEKIFRREMTEIKIEDIEKTVVKKTGFFDKIFQKGRIVLQLKNEEGLLVFYEVKSPEKIQEIIEEMRKKITDILGKKGQTCNVILKDSKAEKIPLKYTYYGDKKENKDHKNTYKL